MKKHPYISPDAELLLLSRADILTASGEDDAGGITGGGSSNDEEPPFWQGGDIVFPDIPLG